MKSVIIESSEGREELARLSAERGVEPERLNELLSVVARHSGMLRRRGLFQQFDAILDERAR